jgi:hypothetical protein
MDKDDLRITILRQRSDIIDKDIEIIKLKRQVRVMDRTNKSLEDRIEQLDSSRDYWLVQYFKMRDNAAELELKTLCSATTPLKGSN